MRNLIRFMLLCCLALASTTAPASAQQAARDGSKDFDWEIGAWATYVRVLRNPLSGEAPNWVEFNGTSVVHALSGGQANLVELDVAGPAGRIQGVSLRLYNVEARQWSLNFASMRDGLLTTPQVGAFTGGRGEFYGPDTLRGCAILVRFVISDVTPKSARFEQAYSADGGKTWEVNWIATDTRLDRAPAPAK